MGEQNTAKDNLYSLADYRRRHAEKAKASDAASEVEPGWVRFADDIPEPPRFDLAAPRGMIDFVDYIFDEQPDDVYGDRDDDGRIYSHGVHEPFATSANCEVDIELESRAHPAETRTPFYRRMRTLGLRHIADAKAVNSVLLQELAEDHNLSYLLISGTTFEKSIYGGYEYFHRLLQREVRDKKQLAEKTQSPNDNASLELSVGHYNRTTLHPEWVSLWGRYRVNP